MRNFLLALASNVALESAMPVLVIVGGLSGLMTAPESVFATLPVAVQMLSGGVTARPIALLMSGFGRRAGFLICAVAMALGGCVGVLALVAGSFSLLVISHAFLGISIVGINFFRYAASETVTEAFRASASSIVLASGIVAVPIGAWMYQSGKDLLEPYTFAGAYMVIALTGLFSCIPISLLRFPRVANRTKNTVNTKVEDQANEDKNSAAVNRTRSITFAIMSMGVGHATMLLVMTPASIVAVAFGFEDSDVSRLIGLHLIAMFAPGFVTGILIKRYGPGTIAGVGAAIQLAGFVIGMLLTETTSLYLSLIFCGVGWNFMFVSGTHLVNVVEDSEKRSNIEGINETLLVLISAGFVLISAPAYEIFGWNFVLGIASLLVFFLVWACHCHVPSNRALKSMDCLFISISYNKTRLELQARGERIRTVAHKAGFGSSQSLNRAIKRNYKTTPAQLIRTLASDHPDIPTLNIAGCPVSLSPYRQ